MNFTFIILCLFFLFPHPFLIWTRLHLWHETQWTRGILNFWNGLFHLLINWTVLLGCSDWSAPDWSSMVTKADTVWLIRCLILKKNRPTEVSFYEPSIRRPLHQRPQWSCGLWIWINCELLRCKFLQCTCIMLDNCFHVLLPVFMQRGGIWRMQENLGHTGFKHVSSGSLSHVFCPWTKVY